MHLELDPMTLANRASETFLIVCLLNNDFLLIIFYRARARQVIEPGCQQCNEQIVPSNILTARLMLE